MRKHTQIDAKTAQAVRSRDVFDEWPCCIACGKPSKDPQGKSLEIHHVVPRGIGGMGIEQNLVLLCHECHSKVTDGDESIHERCKEYLQSRYENWNESDQIYKR